MAYIARKTHTLPYLQGLRRKHEHARINTHDTQVVCGVVLVLMCLMREACRALQMKIYPNAPPPPDMAFPGWEVCICISHAKETYRICKRETCTRQRSGEGVQRVGETTRQQIGGGKLGGGSIWAGGRLGERVRREAWGKREEGGMGEEREWRHGGRGTDD